MAITSKFETQAVSHAGTAATDSAIWVNPTDASKSAIIGTDSKGALNVYDMSGKLVSSLTENASGIGSAADALGTLYASKRAGTLGIDSLVASVPASLTGGCSGLPLSAAAPARPALRDLAVAEPAGRRYYGQGASIGVGGSGWAKLASCRAEPARSAVPLESTLARKRARGKAKRCEFLCK